MMKKLAVGVALAVWGSSVTAQMVGIGRVGALAGLYDTELQADSISLDASELSLGLLAGYTLAWESTFFDVGVEYQSVDGDGDSATFDRTDLLISMGTFLPKDFSFSYGYRFAWQGEDGFLGDDFYRETGPFVGFGLPTLSLPADWEMTSSIAFNFTEFDYAEFNQDVDSFGISGRASVSKPGLPHAFGVRVQRFNVDDVVAGVDFEQTEIYAHLFYQYNFFAMGG